MGNQEEALSEQIMADAQKKAEQVRKKAQDQANQALAEALKAAAADLRLG